MDGEGITGLELKTAVIADDDIVVRHILTAILEGSFKVITFEVGQDCLDYFVTNTADVLFLDIQLPDYSGPEVLNILTEKLGAKMPYVIGVSANQESEMRELFSKAAPNAFLEKPFTPDGVRAILEGRSLG